MKKHLIFYCLLALATFVRATHMPDHGAYLDILSTELPAENGALELTARVKANKAFELDHQPVVSFNAQAGNYFQFSSSDHLKGNLQKGEPFEFRFSLSYIPQKTPFHPQSFSIGLSNKETGLVECAQTVFVYFTPWNTIEVWNDADFAALPRSWAASNTHPIRRTVDRRNLPVSDLTLAEWQDNSVPKCYVHIPGLAYTIPLHAHPNSSNRASNSYTGTVEGVLQTKASLYNVPTDSVLIPVSGLRVELYSIDPLGDEMIGEGYTDENGAFDIFFSESKAVNPLEVYLKVVTETADGLVEVAIGSERLDLMRDTPLVYQPDTYAEQSFDTIYVPNDNIKPQLLHWAHRAMNFVLDELDANSGFDPGQLEALLIKRYVLLPDRSFFTPNPFGRVIAQQPCEDRDIIWIGEYFELNENTLYHEFGHYLMWQLQNDTWSNVVTTGLVYHGPDYNATNAQLAWNEGFAEAVSMILDAYYWEEDGEFNNENIGDGNHESRFLDNSYPEDADYDIIYVGGAAIPGSQALTHGYVSEWNIATALFDLWDGPNNIEPAARPFGQYPLFTNSDDVGIGTQGDEFDKVELSFSEIVQPLIEHPGAGTKWEFDATLYPCELWPLNFDLENPPFWAEFHSGAPENLINSVVEYFENLVDQQDSPKEKGRVARIFDHNKVHNLHDNLGSVSMPSVNQSDFVNTDMLSFQRTVIIPVISLPSTGSSADFLADGSTFEEDFTISIHELNGPIDNYNFTPAGGGARDTLSDDLSVNNSTLFVNTSDREGWQDPGNHFSLPSLAIFPPANFHYDLFMDGDMTFTLRNQGELILGDATSNQSSKVVFLEGSSFIMNPTGQPQGATLIVRDNCRLVIEAGANFSYNTGCTIVLEGANSVLEINGNFDIADQAIFTVEGNGYVEFGLPDEGGNPNIDCGMNSQILLFGGPDIRYRFHIKDGTYVMLDDSKETKTRFLDCEGSMGAGAYWNLGRSDWTAYALEVYGEDPSALGFIFNGFENDLDSLILGNMQVGIRSQDIFGDGDRLDVRRLYLTDLHTGILSETDVNIDGGRASYIDFAGFAVNDAKIWMEHYEFEHSKCGILSTEGGVDLDSVFFDYMDFGWKGIDVNQVSALTHVYGTHCDSAVVDVLGSSSSLFLGSSEFEDNRVGLVGRGPFTVTAECNEINDNSHFGLRMRNQAELSMENSASNDISQNPTSIRFDNAAPPKLDLGANFLNPNTSGDFALLGTLWDPLNPCACTQPLPACAPSLLTPDLAAEANKWSETGWGAASANVDLKSPDLNCSYNLVDVNSVAVQLVCSPSSNKMAPNPSPSQGASGPVLMEGRFRGMSVGEAMTQISKMENEEEALEEWHGLMRMENIHDLENDVLDAAYRGMRRTFSAWLEKETAVRKQGLGHPLIQAQINAIELVKSHLGADPQSSLAFRFDLDLALLYKHTGQTRMALAMMDALNSYEDGLPELLQTCACATEAKQEYLSGAISLLDYFMKAARCTPEEEKLNMDEFSFENGSDPWLLTYPVPASDRLFLRFDEETTGPIEVEIYNLLGHKVLEEEFPNRARGGNSDAELELADLNPGVYLLRAKSGARLSVHRIEVVR